jgi:outer membrane protein assembly factor BamB
MSKRVATLAVLTVSVLAAPVPALARAEGAAPALVAGGGRAAFSGDGGPAVQARLNRPLGAAVAADGTVYVADSLNHRVRAVATDGTIRTVAGNDGQTVPKGSLPAGTKGTDVALGAPNAVAVGADGTVFIADSLASRVYALAADGTIEARVTADLLGGPIATINSLAVSPSGTLYLADRENSRIVEIPAGAGARPVSTPVPLPTGLAADAAGDVWITSATSQLSRLHEGTVATIVGSGDSGWLADEKRPTSSPFNATAVSAGKGGIYLIDNQHRTVRQLRTDGTVTTAAVLPVDPFGAQDPVGVASSMTAAGPLYLVDTVGSRLFSTPVSASGENDSGSSGSAPVWPWIGGGVVAVLLAVLFLTARRRRA